MLLEILNRQVFGGPTEDETMMLTMEMQEQARQREEAFRAEARAANERNSKRTNAELLANVDLLRAREKFPDVLVGTCQHCVRGRVLRNGRTGVAACERCRVAQ